MREGASALAAHAWSCSDLVVVLKCTHNSATCVHSYEYVRYIDRYRNQAGIYVRTCDTISTVRPTGTAGPSSPNRFRTALWNPRTDG